MSHVSSTAFLVRDGRLLTASLARAEIGALLLRTMAIRTSGTALAVSANLNTRICCPYFTIVAVPSWPHVCSVNYGDVSETYGLPSWGSLIC